MANASEGEHALFDSMVLLSVLSTAADVHHRMEQRRIGRDPSEQEEEAYVRRYLMRALDELEEGFMRLHIQQMCALDDAVHQVDQRLLMQRIGRELHVVHQRLLSLYPAVSEDLVEQVRLLERQCAELLDTPPTTFIEQMPEFTDAGLRCVERLRHV